MKVEFLKKFSKDLDDLKVKSVRQALIQTIELMESAESLDKIPQTKKLKGHKTAYRTRVGDYRLGFFFEDSTILLARFVHRRTIYQIFP
jgi:mRNA-degrading endonuclease RelE of RelBE toxin-antitoxin system